jgi:hypothetical protein
MIPSQRSGDRDADHESIGERVAHAMRRNDRMPLAAARLSRSGRKAAIG